MTRNDVSVLSWPPASLRAQMMFLKSSRTSKHLKDCLPLSGSLNGMKRKYWGKRECSGSMAIRYEILQMWA